MRHYHSLGFLHRLGLAGLLCLFCLVILHRVLRGLGARVPLLGNLSHLFCLAHRGVGVQLLVAVLRDCTTITTLRLSV